MRFFFILTSICFSPSYSDFNYCQMKCAHTMCIYNGVSDTCLNYKKPEINDEAKKIILDKHNELRRCIAKGKKYKPEHPEMPKAANMMKFQWHDETAKVAQRWADQCKYGHDACKKLQDMDIGQNVMHKSTTGKVSQVPYVIFIERLYSEILKFNTSIDKFEPQKGVIKKREKSKQGR